MSSDVPSRRRTVYSRAPSVGRFGGSLRRTTKCGVGAPRRGRSPSASLPRAVGQARSGRRSVVVAEVDEGDNAVHVRLADEIVEGLGNQVAVANLQGPRE